MKWHYYLFLINIMSTRYSNTMFLSTLHLWQLNFGRKGRTPSYSTDWEWRNVIILLFDCLWFLRLFVSEGVVCKFNCYCFVIICLKLLLTFSINLYLKKPTFAFGRWIRWCMHLKAHPQFKSQIMEGDCWFNIAIILMTIWEVNQKYTFWLANTTLFVISCVV